MKNIITIVLTTFFTFTLLFNVNAKEVPYGNQTKSTAGLKQGIDEGAACLPGAGFKYLEINNARVRINTGGDMWWDFEVSRYEIPKGSGKTSMFSAALWIGGVDKDGQLKLAAHRFRQGPKGGTPGPYNDFYPGPLTIDKKARVSRDVCTRYDKLFPITRKQVEDHVAWAKNKAAYPDYVIPESIKEWPAHGDPGKEQSYYLAPFFDADGDKNYNPENGDYPYYDLSNVLCHSNQPTMDSDEGVINGGLLSDQVIKGDATLWWVFNDKGDKHSETEGTPIGLEIRAQAFGFSTNDEVNNMTFYSYEIINRSTYQLTGTYFSQWVDPDLGFHKDDYVGCDVLRGLGYCYNGRDVDGNNEAWSYGNQPPAVGVDFFQGPYMDPDFCDNPSFDGDSVGGPTFAGTLEAKCRIVEQNGTTQFMKYRDKTTGQLLEGNFIVRAEAINGVNFGNGIVDDERYGMRRFVYYNNDNSNTGEPRYAPDYYNLLRGIWRDNTRMRYGKNGHPAGGANGPECDFMFPGLTDICDWGTKGIKVSEKNWTEKTVNNAPEDRRFMHSAGPFILQAGAVNYITVGIPWARASNGGAWESVKLLQVVDDKCQLLFDNCFAVINGPDAPNLTIREYENKLVFFINNDENSNNYKEAYKEYDPKISVIAKNLGKELDEYYHFEGYQVFQVANASVSASDIKNLDKARLVYQCDIKNNVSRLINYNYDQSIDADVPVEEVHGNNQGIFHSFVLTEDAFTGKPLVNHKQYYYIALAYGYNQYFKYTTDPALQEVGVSGLGGQKRVYLPGRKNIKTTVGIPHKKVGAIEVTSNYGDGIEITRIEGQGNGGNYLEFTDETINEILSKKPASETNVYGGADYPIAYKAKYKKGQGPISIKVVDPLNVVNSEFQLKLDSLVKYTIPVGITGKSVESTRADWSLIDLKNDKVYRSDTTIDLIDEKIFMDLGISIMINQVLTAGPHLINDFNETPPRTSYDILLKDNGIIASSIHFADSSNVWIQGLKDVDGSIPDLDWIRSGTVIASGANTGDYISGGKAYDPNGNYEKVVGGTWSPYHMVSYYSSSTPLAPGFGILARAKFDHSNSIASIDFVMTPDKSKWTRCAVLEMSPDKRLSEGNAERFSLRKSPSLNINGQAGVVSDDPTLNSNYISDYGMSWFPGYAINIETGERLNIAFGENSWFAKDNGRDMLFNPSSRIIDEGSNFVFGGMHYIYVFAHSDNKKIYPTLDLNCNVNAYDAGETFIRAIKNPNTESNLGFKSELISNIMWVNIPIAVKDKKWLSSEVTVKIRFSKPYKRYFSSEKNSDLLPTNSLNNHYPMYQFSTADIAPKTNNIEKGKKELDLIAVVPNPYNAYSEYERNQVDNRVRIINLPKVCTVRIYTTSGSLIRTFTKDSNSPFIEWDLKNHAGIPISGGVYILHIKVPGIGEKIVKWFGTLRPIDLNSF